MVQPAKKKNTDNKGTTAETIDLNEVSFLVGLMKENDLTELEIHQGTTKIRLKRGNETAESAAVFTPPSSALLTVSSPTAVSTTPAVQPVQEANNTFVIKSPMVGTFYSAPNPESPSFVKVGDTVGAETTVCLIEAMKVYNEIQAECAGKITAVLVKNGSTVEFGSPLFTVTAN
ncbi:MAG: acetyl-CoA carboxylase biotin carboxyl carrier protein [Planctomycetaceae bacterium]|nr:acetyl-CoA carboxylase biotin carboxyl carrier protein [Planctomycetaceae bacterium]